MNYRTGLLCSFLALVMLCFCGCATESNITRLSEQDILIQEQLAEEAREHYYCGQYDQMTQLEPLCQERTTSQPLYLCELGTGYLASNDKVSAKKYLLDAYTSIEEFYDPTSEKTAVSLWGSEAEKVFKGDPYEQATLSLLVGLLLLEDGDIDNALSCFKNGQLADSDVENNEYKSDYGLLQLLEARCYKMRGEQVEYDQFTKKAVDSFVRTHPLVHANRSTLANYANSNAPVEEKTKELQTSLSQAEAFINQQTLSYYEPLIKPYNTMLLVWTGRSPLMNRQGQYGEDRVVVKCPTSESHFEVQLDGSTWHDVIRGFADVGYQATTRGGREMDNVLANQASFKRTTTKIGNAFWDVADDVSDPYAALALFALGAISHGVSSATNVKSDIRCWKTLPEQFAVIPLQLQPGTHLVQIDCYDNNMKLNRTINREFTVDSRPFQFYNFVIPTKEPPAPQEEAETTAKL